jgi:ABC-2 type transport system ATP-binding protein
MAAHPQAADTEIVFDPAPEIPAIHTLDLARRYGHLQALAGLTMTVQQGEIFGFLGPNGAGKTTAVKILVGLTPPSSGEGWLLGEPLGNREVRRRIGYLPELFRYQDWMSAREVLTLHCNLMGLARASRSDELARVLDVVGLSTRASDRVGTFSKGMQQRLGLAVALLGTPDLVFLDEPTSALDPVGRYDVREIIRALKAHGTTVFLNSHLLTEVELVCDRVAIIDRGRLIASGTLDELRGAQHLLRLRVGGDARAIDRIAGAFGSVDLEGEWYTVRGMDARAIPELVESLVRAGVRIHAVEPVSESLEDRFIELLGGDDDDRMDDRAANPA